MVKPPAISPSKVDFGWTSILSEDLASYRWTTLGGRLHNCNFRW